MKPSRAKQRPRHLGRKKPSKLWDKLTKKETDSTEEESLKEPQPKPSHLGMQKESKVWHDLPGDGTNSSVGQGFRETIVDNVKSYCLKTTLHGYCYIVTGSNAAEKVIWLVTCALYFVLGGLVVNQAFVEWTDNPIITSIDTFTYPVEQVEYPTIAVCAKDNYDPWAYVRNTFKDRCDQGKCHGQYRDFLRSLSEDLAGDLQKIPCQKSSGFYSSYSYCSEYSDVNVLQKLAVIAADHDTATEVLEDYLSNFVAERDVSKIESLLSLRIDAMLEYSYVSVSLNNSEAYTDFMSWSWASIWTPVLSCLKSNVTNETFVETTLAESFTGGKHMYCLEREMNKTYGFVYDEFLRFNDAEYAIVDYCLKHHTYSTDYCAENWPNRLDVATWCAEHSCELRITEKLLNMAKGIVFSLKQPIPQSLGLLLETFGDKHYGSVGSKDYQVLKSLLGQKIGEKLVHPRDLTGLLDKHTNPADIPTHIQNYNLQGTLPLVIEFLKNDLLLAQNQDPNANDTHYDLVIPMGNTIGEFVPTITDYGLCEVHNAVSMSKAYRGVPAVSIFSEMFKLDNATNGTVRNIAGSGKSFQRSAWINVKSHRVDCHANGQGTCSAQTGYVTVGMNHWLNFFAVDTMGIIVGAGRETTVKLKPVIHVTSANFRDLPLESRRCRFTNENPKEHSIFTYYTQKSCLFECRLTYAARKVNCTAWEFPQPSNMGICTSVGGRLRSFFEAMEDTKNIASCDCLPDCEETSYEYEVSDTELQAFEFCSSTNGTARRIAVDQFWRRRDFPTWWYERLKAGNVGSETSVFMSEWDLNTICQEEIRENLAMLTISIPSPTVMRVKKTRRVTFTDQLGMLGGTIGLFTGLSLVSINEAFYWVYKTVETLVKKASKKPERKKRRLTGP